MTIVGGPCAKDFDDGDPEKSFDEDNEQAFDDADDAVSNDNKGRFSDVANTRVVGKVEWIVDDDEVNCGGDPDDN